MPAFAQEVVAQRLSSEGAKVDSLKKKHIGDKLTPPDTCYFVFVNASVQVYFVLQY